MRPTITKGCSIALSLFLISLIVEPVFAATQTGFSALFESRLTTLFITINLALTYYFAHRRFDRFAVVHGPEVLTTTGIFGCFLGISIGLLDFDTATSALDKSVPALLEGIKTAFWSSVSGVGGALYIRLRHRITKQPIPQTEGLPKAATLDDLVGVALSLQKSLIGNEDSTLLSQIKLMRQDQSDRLQKLRESFDRFAEKMAEQNSKALIEALKEVIRDFNAKINEQFGDNFKQLNAAVEKLVLWQQQYKEELEKIKEAQERAATDMVSATVAFSKVVERAEAFSTTAEKLRVLLDTLAVQAERITESERTLHAVLVEMRNVIPEFNDKIGRMIGEITEGTKRVQAEVQQATKNLAVQLQSSQSEMKNLLTESIQATHKQASAALQENSRLVKEAVLALDKDLQVELTKALETMGRQLASLSEKFVADYLPLTERLQQVINIARSVQ